MFQRSYSEVRLKDISVGLRGFQGYKKKFKRCVREVSIVFQACFKEVFNKFQECFKNVSMVFQESFKGVSRMIEGHF